MIDELFIQEPIEEAYKFLGKFKLELGVVGENNSRKKKKNSSITNVELMMIHEWGSHIRKIPSRPILQYVLNNCNELINDTIDLVIDVYFKYSKIHEKEAKARILLEKLALQIESKARKTIYKGEGNFSPLKKATIKAKGSNLPLLDTGQLARSITCKVIEK